MYACAYVYLHTYTCLLLKLIIALFEVSVSLCTGYYQTKHPIMTIDYDLPNLYSPNDDSSTLDEEWCLVDVADFTQNTLIKRTEKISELLIL